MATVPSAPNENGVFIGKLYTNGDANEIAKNVSQMLSRLGIQSSDIAKICINTEVGFAKVVVRLPACEEHIVKILSEVSSTCIFHSLTTFLDDLEQFFVTSFSAAADTQQNQAETPAPSSNKVATTMNQAELSQRRKFGAVGAGSSKLKVGISNDSHVYVKPGTRVHIVEKNRMARSELTLRKVTSSSANIPPWELEKAENPITLNAKTSMPFAYPCGCPETVFYHRLQRIESESIDTEFNKGGIVHDQLGFKQMIGKSVCGFLNSRGGTLFFGVTDEGIVQGITLDKDLENDLRLDIDLAVKCIDPTVEAGQYSVNFARVMKDNGESSADLKVLEVCVKPGHSPGRQYSYKNTVYTHQDGGFQIVKGSITTL